MNKISNRLIAYSRQYALVAFLGLGTSIAIAKTVATYNEMSSLANQEWILNDPANPTLAESYSLNTSTPLEDFCEGDEQVCGIIAPNNGFDKPVINNELKLRIESEATADDVFMKN